VLWHPTQAQEQGLNGAPSLRCEYGKKSYQGMKRGARQILLHRQKMFGAPCPGFPVEFVGVDELDAAFLNESRTRGRCLVPRTGNAGQALCLGLSGMPQTRREF
jgi:hypothetical protein